MVISLIENAVENTPKNGEVTVAVKKNTDGDIVISVVDTGFGISQQTVDEVAKVFDDQAALSRNGQETELNLSQVQILAKLHGGMLSLQPLPGSGTSATIRLPLHHQVYST
jgi:signal transduction histidine kinase